MYRSSTVLTNCSNISVYTEALKCFQMNKLQFILRPLGIIEKECKKNRSDAAVATMN